MKLLFHSGTIVLSEPPPLFDAGMLPGVLWDPRTRQFRAPAWRLGELTRELKRRGVRVVNGVRRPARLRGRWRPPLLREYQRAALDAWELSARRGVVVLPTGSGKTRLGLAAIAAGRMAALCMVPTRVLLHQWMGELRRVYDGPVGCLGDGIHELADLTVATYESAYRWMHRIGDRFGLLVIDEVHHFGTARRDEALEMSVSGMRLGLTGTPSSDPQATSSCQQLVGPVVYRQCIDDLAGEYLSEYEIVALELDLSSAERRQYEREIEVFRPVYRSFRRLYPEGDWGAFIRAASRSEEGRKALAAWRRARRLLSYTTAKANLTARLIARHRDSRLLIFTSDNDTAYAVSKEHFIMPITCDIRRRERDQALDRFRKGELRALVSARVLNEGLDVPDADVAIIVGGALGAREHAQRIGRLLRPRHGKRALVYELISRNTSEVFQAQRRREAFAP